MKSRLEDIGRLYERIDRMLDHQVFDETECESLFVDRYLNNKEALYDFCVHVQSLKNKLYSCWEIARGEEDDI